MWRLFGAALFYTLEGNLMEQLTELFTFRATKKLKKIYEEKVSQIIKKRSLRDTMGLLKSGRSDIKREALNEGLDKLLEAEECQEGK